MYYLNQTPVPETPPPTSLGPDTPPAWHHVSSGHAYEWHDGRLHALAAVALTPGDSYVGRWNLPLRVDGRLDPITGGLWHAANPSIVWFWLAIVALACVFAALRLRRRELDVRVARGLALVCLIALTVAGVGEQLHGRPNVSIGQLIVLVVLIAFVCWALRGLVLGRHGWFAFFLIALATLFEGATLIGVLLHGFVLIALPPFVARVAVAACLAAGCALLPVIFRLAEQPDPTARKQEDLPEPDWDQEASWEWDR